MSTAAASDRELLISRVFDAPRELVWKVWTEPQHVAKWWGPHHFSAPLIEIDLRVGGTFRFVMRSPDGHDFAVKGTYSEVEPPRRLVQIMDHSELPSEWHDMVDPDRPKDAGNPPINFPMTTTLEDVGGKTQLTIRVEFASVALRDSMVKIGMAEGWNQSLEKFAAALEATR